MMNPYHIVENSIHIAWNYLEATGELGDPEEASQLLLNEIQSMVRGGETRPLGDRSLQEISPSASPRLIDGYQSHVSNLFRNWLGVREPSEACLERRAWLSVRCRYALRV